MTSTLRTTHPTRPARPARSIRTVALAALALTVLSACGGPGTDGESLGRRELQASNLSQFERRVLEDKTVTAAELEEAGQVLAECLDANGFRVLVAQGRFGPDAIVSEYTAPAGSVDGQLSPEADAEMIALEQGCRDEVSATAAVWVLQNQASEEERQAAVDRLPDCLRAAGLDLAPGVGFDEAARTAVDHQPLDGDLVDETAMAQCLDAALAATTQALPGLADALVALDLGAGSETR